MTAEKAQFIDAVRNESKSRLRYVDAGMTFWRAQSGSLMDSVGIGDEVYELPSEPWPADRMLPRFGRATEGRANARGWPVLYMTDDKDTAMAELRPPVGATITVAKLTSRRRISLVDLTMRKDKELELLRSVFALWPSLDEAFSRPVQRGDDRSEYAPTQLLAEVFREESYDGIMYGSSMRSGASVLLSSTQRSYRFRKAGSSECVRSHTSSNERC